MSLKTLKMRENNRQLHKMYLKRILQIRSILFLCQRWERLCTGREVVFPESFSVARKIKCVPTQLTSSLSNSISSFPMSHCNLSISPAKVQASEEAEKETTCSEQVFTAFNSEFLRCSRRLKGKTKAEW